jgi:hypothetical protein
VGSGNIVANWARQEQLALLTAAYLSVFVTASTCLFLRQHVITPKNR